MEKTEKTSVKDIKKDLNLQHMMFIDRNADILNISFPSKFSAILIKIPASFFILSELEKLIKNVMWESSILATFEKKKTMVNIH